jgi:hypothetical protein
LKNGVGSSELNPGDSDDNIKMENHKIDCWNKLMKFCADWPCVLWQTEGRIVGSHPRGGGIMSIRKTRHINITMVMILSNSV